MEQALPIPYLQPGTAVLARIRQFARNFRPQSANIFYTLSPL